MKTVNLYGCDVASLTMKETIEEVNFVIKNRMYTQHVVLNASKVNLMIKDQELHEIVKRCPIINADGQSVVWASRFLGAPLPERVAGIDLMENVIELAVNSGYSVYFFGAKETALKKVLKHYKDLYPTLHIAGHRNGYFKENENAEIVEEIRNANADILFVAFSSPAKEFWLSKYGEDLNVSFAMGVGGSFDVIAGVTKRAPKWMQERGLEWFYRFSQEPGRMWKRYLYGNSLFVYNTFKIWLTARKVKK